MLAAGHADAGAQAGGATPHPPHHDTPHLPLAQMKRNKSRPLLCAVVVQEQKQNHLLVVLLLVSPLLRVLYLLVRLYFLGFLWTNGLVPNVLS